LRLHTGKVLVIAGSGNNRKRFEAGKFESLLWDPATGEFKQVHTPSDMFCAGHAFLPDGRLLIAGGTTRYEVLEDDVKRAAGAMTIKDESPDARPQVLEKGARIVSPGGTAFRTTREVVIEPAAKRVRPNGTHDGDGERDRGLGGGRQPRPRLGHRAPDPVQRISLYRLRIGNITTAVPTLPIIRKISRRAPSLTRVSSPAAKMYSVSLSIES
jgi:hypothetical protein